MATWAIIVGVDDYTAVEPGGRPNLDGCVNDALGFRKWLVDRETSAANIVALLSPLQENMAKCAQQ